MNQYGSEYTKLPINTQVPTITMNESLQFSFKFEMKSPFSL